MIISLAAGLIVSALATTGTPAITQTNSHIQQPSNHIQLASQEKINNTVEVKDGDTLDGIAQAHQTTYVRLFDANSEINDPDVISVGQKVRIPAADEQLPDRPLPADPVAAVQSAPADQAPVTQSPPVVSAPVYTPPVIQSAPVAGCGDNFYANFIYSHESGCRTTAMSPNGCYGIGQACPASKIAYCGADYACQNAFFTAYAGRYGGWAGAYAFWVAHNWW